MGTVHDLLEAKGKQAILALDIDRSAIEAASAYLGIRQNELLDAG